MFTLSCQNSFVPINLFAIQNKLHIRKGLVVNERPEIADETGDCLTVDFILFQFADIQNADVIEPLAPIKPSENEELLGTNDTCRVPLSARGSLFKLQRVVPMHIFSVQNIEVVRRNYFFQGSSSAIIPSKQINFCSN